eukprot:c16546_g1_i3.p1 GENE.c16546_g1_i3~~c16546_g1_i3.p1  ORF type:complete len:336 (+),score=81.95 c16546_g1_i3:293-1300(+)
MNEFEQAWELSGHKYAQAKRRLGRTAVSDGNLEEAVKHYEDALQANTMHEDTWFRLGSIASELKDYSKAAQAFTECVRLDPCNGQAWNNLAASLLERNKISEAHSALKQALKHLRTHVKVWENFLTVCVKVHDSQGILVSAESLLEISKDKSLDENVLAVLVDLVEMKLTQKQALNETQSSTSDSNSESEDAAVNRFVSRVSNLFSKLTESVSPNGLMWSQYARFKFIMDDKKQAVEFQTRACRCLDVPGWECTKDDAERIFDQLLKLAFFALEFGDKQPLFSIRSFIKSVLKRGAENFSNLPSYSELEKALQDVLEFERASKAAAAEGEFRTPQ